MAGSISSASYSPGQPPADPQALPQYLAMEFAKIQQAVSRLAAGHLDPAYVAPDKPRDGDIRFADGTSWDPGSGSGLYYYSSGWRKLIDLGAAGKAKLSDEGGMLVKMTNKTGAATIKGYVVGNSSTTANAFEKILIDAPDPFGVIYESGVADGSEAWIVVGGIAEVYVTGSVSLNDFVRGWLTADGAGYVAGQGKAEAFPAAPFTSDKHFYEIGHAIEARTGAGLVKCVVHWN